MDTARAFSPNYFFYQNFPQLCRPMSSRRRRKGKNLTSGYVKSSWLRVFACFHRCHVTLTVTLGEGCQSCTAAEVMWAQHRCLQRHLARLTFSSGYKDAALVNVGCSATLKSGREKKKNHKKVHVFLLLFIMTHRQFVALKLFSLGKIELFNTKRWFDIEVNSLSKSCHVSRSNIQFS